MDRWDLLPAHPTGSGGAAGCDGSTRGTAHGERLSPPVTCPEGQQLLPAAPSGKDELWLSPMGRGQCGGPQLPSTQWRAQGCDGGDGLVHAPGMGYGQVGLYPPVGRRWVLPRLLAPNAQDCCASTARVPPQPPLTHSSATQSSPSGDWALQGSTSGDVTRPCMAPLCAGRASGPISTHSPTSCTGEPCGVNKRRTEAAQEGAQGLCPHPFPIGGMSLFQWRRRLPWPDLELVLGGRAKAPASSRNPLCDQQPTAATPLPAAAWQLPPWKPPHLPGAEAAETKGPGSEQAQAGPCSEGTGCSCGVPAPTWTQPWGARTHTAPSSSTDSEPRAGHSATGTDAPYVLPHLFLLSSLQRPLPGSGPGSGGLG